MILDSGHDNTEGAVPAKAYHTMQVHLNFFSGELGTDTRVLSIPLSVTVRSHTTDAFRPLQRPRVPRKCENLLGYS